jgi:hypothetical protein
MHTWGLRCSALLNSSADLTSRGIFELCVMFALRVFRDATQDLEAGGCAGFGHPRQAHSHQIIAHALMHERFVLLHACMQMALRPHAPTRRSGGH